MKVKELMIYCRNRLCSECQQTEACIAFQKRFDCSPDIMTKDKDLFELKIDILADHGNEELKKL